MFLGISIFHDNSTQLTRSRNFSCAVSALVLNLVFIASASG